MAANKSTKNLPGAVGIGSGGGIIRLDDVTNTQGRTIPDATPRNSGVMTTLQAQQLAALVAGGGGGGPTTGLIANAVIDQFALIKASTVAGRFEMLQPGDSPLLMVGVSATAAAGAGATFSAQLIPGTETTMLGDGTGVINAGDTVTPSTTVAGRVKAGASNVVGSALSAAAAVLNAQVTVL